jgi:spore photoproduct lyase
MLAYISIGVVRFTRDTYKDVVKNYPKSYITNYDYSKSFDGKIRYNKPMRMWIMNTVKDLCLKAGVDENKIYLCMEEN